MADREIRELLGGAVDKAHREKQFDGILGRLNADESITLSTGRNYYVYVRIVEHGQVRSTVPVLNKAVANVPNLPVIIKENKDKILEVMEIDPSKINQFLNENTPSTLAPQHTHNMDSGNPDFVETLRLLEGLVRIDDGLVVAVEKIHNVRYNGTDNFYGGETIDLTDYVPVTAGTHKWVKIYFDPSTLTAGVAEGSETSNALPLDPDDLFSISLTSPAVPLMGIQLFNEQTQLRLIDFFDCRPWLFNFTNISAPNDAKFIIQVADVDLPNAQDLGSLATGLLKNTTTTGVLVIATAGTDYVTPTGVETLTNKTIDSAKYDEILDTNGNQEITFTATASAVNEINISNAATGNAPKVEAHGDNTDINLEIGGKGTGNIKALTPVDMNDKQIKNTLYQDYKDTTEPTSPSAGYLRLFALDGKMQRKNSAGDVVNLETGGGSGDVSLLTSVAIYEEQQPQNTNAGTFGAGTTVKRSINTEVSDLNSLAHLSGNDIVIDVPGIYLIEWWATALGVSQNQTFLYDETGSAEYKRGSSSYALSSPAESQSKGSYIISIAASRTISLKHYAVGGRVADGLGAVTNNGIEVYSQVKLTKISVPTFDELGGLSFHPSRATMWHDESTVLTGNAKRTTIDSGQKFYTYTDQYPYANGDQFTHSFILDEGTYDFSVLGVTASECGKIDWEWSDDGIAWNSIVAGQDWYVGGVGYGTVKIVNNVSIASTGRHILRGTVNGKNASGSNYRMVLTKFWFSPATDTADLTRFATGASSIVKRAMMMHTDAIIISGASPLYVDNGSGNLMYFRAFQLPSANGDSFTNSCYISAGTYTFKVWGEINADRAKLDWYLDEESTPFISGQDWYGGAQTHTYKSGTVTIGRDGMHKFRAVVNGKNASSSNYYMVLQYYSLVPSSDVHIPLNSGTLKNIWMRF